MNNGDRIRKMSNRELCKFMFSTCVDSKYNGIWIPELEEYLCSCELLDYLDEEISEEETEKLFTEPNAFLIPVQGSEDEIQCTNCGTKMKQYLINDIGDVHFCPVCGETVNTKYIK